MRGHLQGSIGGTKKLVFTRVFPAHKDFSCKLIEIKFRSDHKYEAKSGYPTFWNHVVDALKFKTDHLSVPKVT